jgi:hypothetical protein
VKRNYALIIIFAIITTSSGCAYRYYIGMKGPSIRKYPEIHTDAITEDRQCLECHSPKNTSDGAPATTHPEFTGCIACHHDPVK